MLINISIRESLQVFLMQFPNANMCPNFYDVKKFIKYFGCNNNLPFPTFTMVEKKVDR